MTRFIQRGSMLLAAAFAALLLVIGVSAFAVWRSARDTQDRVGTLHDAHMQADNSVDAIRANVYLLGILTRDYLLDQDPTHAEQYTAQFDAVLAGTQESFASLERSAEDEAQRSALSELRREFDEYSEVTALILTWSPEEKRVRGAEMLRQRLRRRQEIFALAEQEQQLVTANFERQGKEITRADQDFRFSFGWTTAIALLLGLAISGVTLARLMGLERQSQAAESELRRLSGQLRTAQEQERKFLSRELHDQVGQLLTGLRMELGSMARLQDQAGGALSLGLARAKMTTEQILRVVRDIAMLLRPSMLDDLGLTPALAWLVREVSRSSGMDIQMDIDPASDSLPDAHRTCVYRVVQEALTNASRHSGARRVQLAVETGNGWVSGTISDDGRGFQIDTANRRGLGLVGMEERARELGGTVEVISAPGRGTRVHFRLPHPVVSEVPDDKDLDRGRSRHRPDRVETSA